MTYQLCSDSARGERPAGAVGRQRTPRGRNCTLIRGPAA